MGAPVTTMAVYTDDEVRILIVNYEKVDMVIKLSFDDGIGSRLKPSAAYVTSEAHDFGQAKLPIFKNDIWMFSSASMSMNSFIFTIS